MQEVTDHVFCGVEARLDTGVSLRQCGPASFCGAASVWSVGEQEACTVDTEGTPYKADAGVEAGEDRRQVICLVLAEHLRLGRQEDAIVVVYLLP